MAEYATESEALGLLAALHDMKISTASRRLQDRLNAAYQMGRAHGLDERVDEIARLKRRIAELEPDPPEEDAAQSEPDFNDAYYAAGFAAGMAVQEHAAPQSPTVGEVVADAVAGMIDLYEADGELADKAFQRERQDLIDAINSLREND